MFAKKIVILYCCLLIVFSLSMFGQESHGSKGNTLDYNDIQKDKTIVSDITNETQNLKMSMAWMDAVDLNLVTLTQMGHMNQATIEQISDSNNPNQVMVMQNGDQNVSDIHQTGSKNALKLIQHGKMNSMSANYEGEYLNNTIIQIGNLNVVEQTLQGSDMNFSIIQQGKGHELIQFEKGPGIGYSVKQTGHDMKISIEQGHVMRK